MTPVQLDRIFQPFEQVGELPRREGGAGLGLAISRQLVRLMGGDIEVQSEIGKGSLFWFELDLPVIENPLASPSEERIVLGYEGPRRRVLIVDDVPQNRAMLMDALSSFGFDVFDAVNGREGLDLAERIRPDLIVMDVMMPVMDGLEATRRIRALPTLARIPIIGVTASATPADEARSYAAGVDAFVPKPIATDLLLRLIGEHLHLVWIYDEIVREAEAVGDGAAEDPVPPQDEMEALHRLALEGYMRPIREQADRLMDLDPSYQPFATRLMRLAEGYQSKAILALIERHLK
jgi:CheY-like chemotaxis protein